MKRKILIYTISTAGIIGALLSLVYGSYLPLAKARRYIHALRAAPSIKSSVEFKENFDAVFNFYSPIGSEEIAKFLSSDIVGIVSNPEQPEAAMRAIVSYIEPHMFTGNVRHLLALGNFYRALWKNYGNDADFVIAEKYFKEAREIGPKLPPVLYNILALYQERRDAEKAKEVGEAILELWPDDSQVKALVESISKIE